VHISAQINFSQVLGTTVNCTPNIFIFLGNRKTETTVQCLKNPTHKVTMTSFVYYGHVLPTPCCRATSRNRR